jgi:hypothetical protein
MLLCVLYCAQAGTLPVSVAYHASDAVLQNPYIGSVVWATDKSRHEQPFTLVYADLTWADFEPEQGQYDFASFERKNQFARWRAEGKHLIFRFVLDVPGDKAHRDIPNWLFQATGQDGTQYNVSYGRGYSPNYANPVLIRAHVDAIAAIGERYGDDPFVAYVELGSLGHWGEWHVHQKLGLMPNAAVRDQYVLPYIDAFPNAYLMMRRPFAIAADYGLGLFNDTAGEPDSTNAWLDWIQNGGNYESPDGRGALVPTPDAWQSAPIGGELSTILTHEALLRDDFQQTLSLFIQSHTSWIGPGSFADIAQNGKDQTALDDINRTIGYRLRVARCDVSETAAGDVQVTLYWTNDGIAPFYFDWQPTLSVLDAAGSETLLPLDLNLIDVLPELTVSVSVALPPQTGAYTLRVGIVDPTTGEPGVALAMQASQDGLWYELMQVQVSKKIEHLLVGSIYLVSTARINPTPFDTW